MRSRKRTRKATFCPTIEQLEDRCTPSTSGVPITISSKSAILGYEFIGTVNQSFSATLTASGGSGTGYNFSQALEAQGSWPLPPGTSGNVFALNPKTGVITGTPSTPGQYNVSFQVTDSAGNIDSTVFQFLISPQTPTYSVSANSVPGAPLGPAPLTALNALQYNSQTLPLGIVDQPYNATVSATNPTTDGITKVQVTTLNTKGGFYAAGSTLPGINATTLGNVCTITGLDGENGPALTVSRTPTAVTITGTPTFSAGGFSYPLFLSVTFQDGTTKEFNFSFGYSPQEIENAYGLNNVGSGAGQTIVVLEAGGLPNLVSSSDPNFANSDLNQFDQIFPGLNTFAPLGQSGGPVFLKVNQSGGNTYDSSTYPTATNVPAEEIQDIEWVHALAPMANIVDMECSVPLGDTDEQAVAIGLQNIQSNPAQFLQTLEHQGLPAPPSGSLFVVGTSYGGGIDGAKSITGITYVESSGDFGPTGKSANVVLTGYTQLTQSLTSSYVSEAALNDVAVPYYLNYRGGGILESGGGTDLTSTPSPNYQFGINNQFTTPPAGRAGPDVGFNGAPVSGDVEFNSTVNSFATNNLTKSTNADLGGGPWEDAWGTSMASPSWDAIFAIVNQGRAALGKSSLSGTSQTLPMLYSLAGKSAFHQVPLGLTGTGGTQSLAPIATGGAIYNTRAGLGSPNGDILIPDLIGPTLTANSGLWAAAGPTLTITGSDFSPSGTYSVSFTNPNITGTVAYSSPTTLIVSNLTGLSGLATGTPLKATITMIVPVGSTTYTDTTGNFVEVASIPQSLSNTIYVNNLYTLLLHRGADPGAATWVDLLNAGISPATVIQDIEQSPEYLNDVVTALYQHYLNRAPDPGAQGWVTALENGNTIEQVITGIVGSPEFYQDSGGSNSGYVNGLYKLILRPGRRPCWLHGLDQRPCHRHVCARPWRWDS